MEGKMTENKKEKKAYLDTGRLEDYLGSNLYCREERQFAVFLYNIFLEEKNNTNAVTNPLINYCLDISSSQTARIKEAYFEATLMRDYFERDRSYFNRDILEFCLGWLCYGSNIINEMLNKLAIKDINNPDKTSRNLGQQKAKKIIMEKYPGYPGKLAMAIKSGETDYETRQEAREKACFDIAGMMMNAVPDILVIYQLQNGSICAKALECKYLSGEGTYLDIAGANCKMQLFIQECIMHFCFGKSIKSTKRHIPKFPRGSQIWSNEKLWENICLNVYEGILNQNWKSQDILNAGVEKIQFIKPGDCANKTVYTIPAGSTRLGVYRE